MATAVFEVVRAGPHASIQDGGRPGFMRIGVPASGPMDRGAFAAANAVLGNRPGAAGLEISLGGLALDCIEGSVTVAVAGGGFRVTIDDAAGSSWRVATVRKGMRLVVEPGFWGSWSYLAVAGRLLAAPWLGSVSTHGPSGLGGGRLAAGQQIVVEDADPGRRPDGEIACPVSARPRQLVRVVLGPQDRFFSTATVETLLTQPFALSDAYDRMGVRLAGSSLRPEAALDMPSEAIAPGSIQVSGDGVPTVLLADHQTTGGYPKIATVLSGDLDGFVQLRSRDRVTFQAVSPDAAIRTARTRRFQMARFLAALGT